MKKPRDPEKARQAANRWYAKHRDRLYANSEWVENKKTQKRLWARAHPEVGRKSRLKQLYDLSWDEYQELLRLQGSRCAICGDLMDRPHVDHNHHTQQVRELLCGFCNTGIGMFKEDEFRLKAAVEYLRRWV